MKCLPTLLLVAALASPAHAHFLWLVPKGAAENQSTIHVYFGEDGEDDSPDYLSFVKGVSVKHVAGSEAGKPVSLTTSDSGISGPVSFQKNSLIVATVDAGVMDRGDSVFRLKYYAKAGPSVSHKNWTKAKTADDLRLDIIPHHSENKIKLTVTFDGKPLADAQVKVLGAGGGEVELTTDSVGVATADAAENGLYSIRVRHVETKAGELKGKKYPEVRHYSTIALNVSSAGSPADVSSLRSLAQPVTSFGAAISEGSLYMYGGHTGGAHSYSKEEQANELLKLDLTSGQWSTLAKGPHLQGLALVTHNGQLYRVGGFTAENAEGEENRLVSQDLMVRFDPQEGNWEQLPSLPEPRSSHDAAVVGDSIYVVGGWAMSPDADSQWHSTAWTMDLTQESLSWKPIAEPPFQRRAIAAAAHAGKLFIIGGMQKKGGPTTAVAIYDPATDSWSEGPALAVIKEEQPEDGQRSRRRMSSGNMTGFGASAFATGGRLYASTVQGTLQRLTSDGKTWEIVQKDLTPRFFHRLLPLDPNRLLAVGGANMEIGKFEKIDIINVSGRQ